MNLEETLKDVKSLVGKKHYSVKIEKQETYDLSNKKLPETYSDGRVITDEKYVQVK